MHVGVFQALPGRSRGLQGIPGASRGLQGPPGPSESCRGSRGLGHGFERPEAGCLGEFGGLHSLRKASRISRLYPSSYKNVVLPNPKTINPKPYLRTPFHAPFIPLSGGFYKKLVSKGSHDYFMPLWSLAPQESKWEYYGL